VTSAVTGYQGEERTLSHSFALEPYLHPPKRRFTGSAGTAIVTETEAHLFVDTRYWVQAAKEIDSSVWTLEKLGQKDVKNWNDWVLGVGGHSLRREWRQSADG
jgi:hypothetical protein